MREPALRTPQIEEQRKRCIIAVDENLDVKAVKHTSKWQLEEDSINERCDDYFLKLKQKIKRNHCHERPNALKFDLLEHQK